MSDPALRCATYARYSSDQQRESSIVDQQRNIQRFADAKAWKILPEYVFSDEGRSGAGSDRPGLNRLLAAASLIPHVFDAILVDDTSRISRNLADAVRIREQLSFLGIRLIAVSQGIDSEDEQADVMLTVHGLVDSLYIKELAKKTHRGLEGLALAGFHTGGKCFGYRNVQVGDRVHLQIDPDEAAIVRRIFEMSASGVSLKNIAKTLNTEGVPPPRGSKQKARPSWVYTAIREMLRRELYVGKIVWNKRKYKKKPGTNKRISVLRPENEWVVAEDSSLRIVPQELWDRVQQRIEVVAKQFGTGRPGLLKRSASAPYLFSGILKCGICGANLAIVDGRGHASSRMGLYGCPHNRNRGVCSNSVLQRRDEIEDLLLAGLQRELEKPDVIAYAVSEIEAALERDASSSIDTGADLKLRAAELEQELNNLAEAVAKSGGSKFLLERLQAKERELEGIREAISATPKATHAEVDLDWLRCRVSEEIAELPALLNDDPVRSRIQILLHVSEISMTPVVTETNSYYVAEGQWDLLGNGAENMKVTGALLNGDFRSVAGGGFEPPTFGL